MNFFEQLKKWLGIIDSLKMFDRIERGIYSSIAIPKNKIIIKIKSKYLIEYQQINKIYPIEDIEEANSLVAFYLTKLYFDNNEFWLNYLNTFPKNVSEYVQFWSKEDLDQLLCTSICSNHDINLDSFIESIEYDYQILNQYNKTNRIIEYTDENEFYQVYIRFRLLVGSRIFGYVKYGIETSGMVPYIDLINHSNEPNTTWYFDDSLDSFVLISTKDIGKCEEILDDYGIKSNVELLLYYGFTLYPSPKPLLRFCLNNQIYEFDEFTQLDNLDSKQLKEIKNKLVQINLSHCSKVKQIKNKTILNIYLDELFIIDKVLNLLKTQT